MLENFHGCSVSINFAMCCTRPAKERYAVYVESARNESRHGVLAIFSPLLFSSSLTCQTSEPGRKVGSRPERERAKTSLIHFRLLVLSHSHSLTRFSFRRHRFIHLNNSEVQVGTGDRQTERDLTTQYRLRLSLHLGERSPALLAMHACDRPRKH